jgi:hypothetical protein
MVEQLQLKHVTHSPVQFGNEFRNLKKIESFIAVQDRFDLSAMV